MAVVKGSSDTLRATVVDPSAGDGTGGTVTIDVPATSADWYTEQTPSGGPVIASGTADPRFGTDDGASGEIVMGTIYDQITVNTWGTGTAYYNPPDLSGLPDGYVLQSAQYVATAYSVAGHSIDPAAAASDFDPSETPLPQTIPILEFDSSSRSNYYVLDHMPVGAYGGPVVMRTINDMSGVNAGNPMGRIHLKGDTFTPDAVHVTYLAIRLTYGAPATPPPAPGDPVKVLVDGAETWVTAQGLSGYTPSVGDRLLVQRVGTLLEVVQFLERAVLPEGSVSDAQIAEIEASIIAQTVTVTVAPTIPDSAKVGDFWQDTSVYPSPTYICSDAYASGEADISFWTPSDSAALAAAEANPSNYVQAVMPASANVGDFWTNTTALPYTVFACIAAYSGSTGTIPANWYQTDTNAYSYAGSKAHTFVQTLIPTNVNTGDVWIDLAVSPPITYLCTTAYATGGTIAANWKQADAPAVAQANTKNRIQYLTSAPTAATPGWPGDAVWVVSGSAFTAYYKCTAGTGTTSGNTWVAQTIDGSLILAHLDAGSITTGSLVGITIKQAAAVGNVTLSNGNLAIDNGGTGDIFSIRYNAAGLINGVGAHCFQLSTLDGIDNLPLLIYSGAQVAIDTLNAGTIDLGHTATYAVGSSGPFLPSVRVRSTGVSTTPAEFDVYGNLYVAGASTLTGAVNTGDGFSVGGNLTVYGNQWQDGAATFAGPVVDKDIFTWAGGGTIASNASFITPTGGGNNWTRITSTAISGLGVPANWSNPAAGVMTCQVAGTYEIFVSGDTSAPSTAAASSRSTIGAQKNGSGNLTPRGVCPLTAGVSVGVAAGPIYGTFAVGDTLQLIYTQNSGVSVTANNFGISMQRIS